jgi:hypothetical protein
MEVLAVIPFGSALKVIGRGIKTGQSCDPVLSPDQIAQLTMRGESEPWRFRSCTGGWAGTSPSTTTSGFISR